MRKSGALVVLALAVAATLAALTGGASASRVVYPATSVSPAAGFCDDNQGPVVTVHLLYDMSAARCYKVSKNQRLRFVNDSHTPMRLLAPFLGFTLQPGESRAVKGHVRTYLAPGDHSVGSSAWCCFGFDIYLPGAPAPAPGAVG